MVVVGGGPAGATAADDLAAAGHAVLLLDRAGRIKPCGGAIPPRLIRDFDIPDELLVARITAARMVAPSDRNVDMPIENGFVGMVDREHFDEWLRERAAGARRAAAHRHLQGAHARPRRHRAGPLPRGRRRRRRAGQRARARRDRRRRRDLGSRAPERRRAPGACATSSPITRSSARRASRTAGFDAQRCDVYYRGALSPDFYAWVFPHGDTTSVGIGSAHKGFSLRGAVAALRGATGLDGETMRREGAPIPMKPLPRWDNGRDVVLAGDAAGVVAPASGEGIYYAMVGGRLAARGGGDAARDRRRARAASWRASAS